MFEVKNPLAPIALSIVCFGALSCSEKNSAAVNAPSEATSKPETPIKPVERKAVEVPIELLEQSKFFARKEEFEKLVGPTMALHNSLVKLHMALFKTEPGDTVPEVDCVTPLELFIDRYRPLSGSLDGRELHPFHGAKKGETVKIHALSNAEAFKSMLDSLGSGATDLKAPLETLIRELRLLVDCTTGKYG